ncbi:MAG: DUF805 domain-containing protein [Propionibacteriaceae bacterium]
MSQDPYGQQDPYRSGNYEDYSQGYSSPPQQPAPQYGQPTPQYGQPAPQYGQPAPQQPAYGQAPTDPYGQPTYSDPTYGQAPYTQPGYGQGYQATPSYGLAPYTAVLDANPRPTVTMPQAVKLWLKNWKNFSGRASRSEFWWAYLAIVIAETVIAVVFTIIGVVISAATNSSDIMAVVMLLLMGVVGLGALAALVPTVAMGVRRLHDTNQSGWMYLLTFIPYVGGIILLVLMAQPSNPMGARFDDRAQPLYGPENI